MEFEVKELNQENINESLLETLKNLTEVGELSLEEMKNILSKMHSQNIHTFIAQTKDGEIVGATSLLIEQKFIHAGGLVGHIEDVATRKDCERNSVGSSVVKKALEKAKELGCYKVILDCKEDIVPFYGKLGFKKDIICMRVNLK